MYITSLASKVNIDLYNGLSPAQHRPIVQTSTDLSRYDPMERRIMEICSECLCFYYRIYQWAPAKHVNARLGAGNLSTYASAINNNGMTFQPESRYLYQC